VKKKKPSLRIPIVCATYGQLKEAIICRLVDVYLEDSNLICTVIDLIEINSLGFELSLRGREIKVAQAFNQQRVDRLTERAYDNFLKDRQLPYYPNMIHFVQNQIVVELVTVH